MEKQYFGVMLDMSRNAVMSVPTVKKYVDYLEKFGYNSLLLYTEDTYEVKNEPYFGYLRGRYSMEEIKEIDAYCVSKGIELIPCIQTLAHLSAIFRWKEYSAANDVNDILLADEPRTYELIENMFKTISETFTSRNVHIGMDEAHMLGLGKYLDKNGFTNRFDILKGHLEKVIKISNRYGFKPIMWSDMFLRLANKGDYYGRAPLTQEVYDSVPEGVDLVYWDYYHNKKSDYDFFAKEHKQLCESTWFAGGAWAWNGFAPLNKISIRRTKAAVSACREQGINNIFLTVWGDNGSECSYFSILPTLFAAKKFHEGITDMAVIKAEFESLIGEDFDKMILLDLPNEVYRESKQLYRESSAAKFLLYNDLFLGYLDPTIPDTAAKAYKTDARRLKNASKGSAFAYIFEELSALCEVLAIKCDIAKRLRPAYQAGDKAELAKIADDMKVMGKKLELFYAKFKALWRAENKMHGFDIQDARMGALMLRFRSCRERIIEYVNGSIDRIEELDEQILPPSMWIDLNGESFVFNNWARTISVNSIGGI